MKVFGMQDAFTAAGEGKVKMAVIHDDISFTLPSVNGDSSFILLRVVPRLGQYRT